MLPILFNYILNNNPCKVFPIRLHSTTECSRIKAMEDRIKSIIIDRVIRGIDKALGPKPDKPKPSYYDQQIERINKRLAELNELERQAQTIPEQSQTETPSESQGFRRDTALHHPLPSKEETITVLKRRLALELYKAELDLADKLKIFGKPCDCLDVKHNLEIQAVAEELIPKEPENPVYSEIIEWLRNNQEKITVDASASGLYDNEYPAMAAQFADFRKRVTGTLSKEYFLSAEDKERIKQRTQEVLERELGNK